MVFFYKALVGTAARADLAVSSYFDSTVS